MGVVDSSQRDEGTPSRRTLSYTLRLSVTEREALVLIAAFEDCTEADVLRDALVTYINERLRSYRHVPEERFTDEQRRIIENLDTLMEL
jgi:hypothetical protein